MAATQPQCANIGGAGMCYSVMAIKRLVGLDGPNCCAACAALPTCGAWQLNIEPTEDAAPRPDLGALGRNLAILETEVLELKASVHGSACSEPDGPNRRAFWSA